ncbi:hypothetical protein BRD10_00875 [Halobacteriales archaeon SW_12_71_31]|nr:MAG: hypothetical protein BRD10_00875 [Halobacteriales archaeon SW_12_71_31]
MTEDYTFRGLPMAPVLPGTTLLVSGPSHAGTREVAYSMLAGAEDEGVVVVTTNQRASRIARNFEAASTGLDPARSAIVSCVGQDDRDADVDARLAEVTGPGDLTGIGMRYSKLVEDPDAVDERVLSNVAQFCDARVDVREGDDTPEMRVRGLPGQSREWTAVELYG